MTFAIYFLKFHEKKKTFFSNIFAIFLEISQDCHSKTLTRTFSTFRHNTEAKHQHHA